MKLTRAEIERKISPVLSKYSLVSVSLVGSTARNEHSNMSDIDLIVELRQPVSLLTFSKIKREIEATKHISAEYRRLWNHKKQKTTNPKLLT